MIFHLFSDPDQLKFETNLRETPLCIVPEALYYMSWYMMPKDIDFDDIKFPVDQLDNKNRSLKFPSNPCTYVSLIFLQCFIHRLILVGFR